MATVRIMLASLRSRSFRRRIVAITAALLVVLPMTAFAAELPPGGTFLDDDNSPHQGAIEAIAAAGITRGCNPPLNDHFCPRDSVTRGQMAAFLVRALDLPATTETPFTDTTGVFFDDINRLAAAGITRGCNPPSNDRYCPNSPVTREQMATFLARGLDLELLDPPPRPGPPTGNPDGTAPIPQEAGAVDTSNPDIVIGNGTPQSCTSQAVVDAVAQGGVIVFDCGPDPVTIEMLETAKVFNDTGPEIVLDGRGKVTLSGRGQNRILYMNTCDPAQVWTTPHCQNQDHPQLTVQNLTFVDGNSKGDDPDGGGAIWVRGGRFKVVNSRFFNNVCDDVGPDVGGAAIRVFSQYQGLPVYIVNSTFGGGEGYGNVCSNGGGLSSIGVSYTVINSLFTHNLAIGNGANPAQGGTPGGGSGGAIYNDGNTFTLTVIDTVIEDNHANEGGGAIFFVSNDRSGTLRIEDSILRRNPSDGFETRGYPGIFYLGKGPPQVVNSTLEP